METAIMKPSIERSQMRGLPLKKSKKKRNNRKENPRGRSGRKRTSIRLRRNKMRKV